MLTHFRNHWAPFGRSRYTLHKHLPNAGKYARHGSYEKSCVPYWKKSNDSLPFPRGPWILFIREVFERWRNKQWKSIADRVLKRSSFKSGSGSGVCTRGMLELSLDFRLLPSRHIKIYSIAQGLPKRCNCGKKIIAAKRQVTLSKITIHCDSVRECLGRTQCIDSHWAHR